jgi:hypothetical protein
MFDVIQMLSLIFVAVAMVPALAHGLELPGKLRLAKDAYLAVQPIYYPGFTIAGMSEPLALISTVVLAVLTPRGTPDFWLTLVALLGLIGMQAVYWFVTHPVNNFWLKGEKLSGLGSGFFSLGTEDKRDRGSETHAANWTAMRDRWEYSHVARAALAGLSFIALVVAIA